MRQFAGETGGDGDRTGCKSLVRLTVGWVQGTEAHCMWMCGAQHTHIQPAAYTVQRSNRVHAAPYMPCGHCGTREV
jgi:hypothetical protein